MRSNKILLFLFIYLSTAITFVAAQTQQGNQNPPEPEYQTMSDAFGGNPPTSPVDMYVYILAIAGIVFTIYFAKRYKKQLS